MLRRFERSCIDKPGRRRVHALPPHRPRRPTPRHGLAPSENRYLHDRRRRRRLRLTCRDARPPVVERRRPGWVIGVAGVGIGSVAMFLVGLFVLVPNQVDREHDQRIRENRASAAQIAANRAKIAAVQAGLDQANRDRAARGEPPIVIVVPAPAGTPAPAPISGSTPVPTVASTSTTSTSMPAPIPKPCQVGIPGVVCIGP